MSQSKTFYFAFLRQLLLEVKECYPEFCWDHDFRVLNELEGDEYSLALHVVTLSSIGKSIDNALISNKPLAFDPSGLHPGYFTKDEPFLLGGLIHDVFIRNGREGNLYHSRYSLDDRGHIIRSDGYLGEELETDLRTAQSVASSIFFLRQFYLSFSKVGDLQCLANETEEWAGFVRRISSEPEVRLDGGLLQNAKNLLACVFSPTGDLHEYLRDWLDNPVGFHGPGAVSGREKGGEKWYFSVIEGQKPDIFDAQTSSMRGFKTAQPNSRATMVPKDFRKHRIICIEPKEFMFEQQGLWRTIAKIVAESPLTRNTIDFSDQELSQRQCRSFGSFSTIDLSDASDTLSLKLGRLLLGDEIFRILSASRSRHVVVNGSLAFSPKSLFTMGNALCFPIETLIFWAISNAAILNADGVTITNSINPSVASKLCGDSVRVFGDDIIVRRRYFHMVMDALRRSGLQPNESKCCHSSLVREACGAWWFAKVDCRITRLSKANSTSLTDWCGGLEQAKALSAIGLKHASRALLDHLDDIWPVPYGYYGLPGRRGEVDRKHIRWNWKLQRYEYEMPVSIGTTNRSLTGERGLYAFFTGSATSASITRVLERPKICWVHLQ